MKQVIISDRTLCSESKFSFKEKLEIARLLDKIRVDAIELPAINEGAADPLFVRTLSAFVRDTVISVEAGLDEGSIRRAADALSAAKRPRIRIALPLSPVGMEYTCHKKPAKMIEWITASVSLAASLVPDVEFEGMDATRAEEEFLISAYSAAVAAGAKSVSVSDTAACGMPDTFAAFAAKIAGAAGVPTSVSVSDLNGLSTASALLAVRGGCAGVKTAVGGEITDLETFANLLRNCGDNLGLTCTLKQTELRRTVRQIGWIDRGNGETKAIGAGKETTDAEIKLGDGDGRDAVQSAVARLGYDLSDEDLSRVTEEVGRVSKKKTVGQRELEAIIATAAMQVPSTYRLENYVINTGNAMSSTAQITLSDAGESKQGIAIGDGPIDASFRAIESVIGHRYELDDFQIQAVTEGKEAVGSALIRLRSAGKLYSGNGVSTDIIGAAILAYLNAVNKITYEEN